MTLRTLLREVRAECARVLPGARVRRLRAPHYVTPRIRVTAHAASLDIYAADNVDATYGEGDTPYRDWRAALQGMRRHLRAERRALDRALRDRPADLQAEVARLTAQMDSMCQRYNAALDRQRAAGDAVVAGLDARLAAVVAERDALRAELAALRCATGKEWRVCEAEALAALRLKRAALRPAPLTAAEVEYARGLAEET